MLSTTTRTHIARSLMTILSTVFLVQCGTSTAGPTLPPPPPTAGTSVPGQLTEPTTAALCALRQGAAALINAANGTTETGTIATQDCNVADQLSLSSINPGGDGFFESLQVYIQGSDVQEVVFEVTSNDFDPAIAVFEVRPATGGGQDQLILIDSNDDRSAADRNSLLRVDLDPGPIRVGAENRYRGYVVMVSGFDQNETGSYTLFMGPVDSSTPPSPPAPGSVSVSTSTAGDPTGMYSVVVGGNKEKAIAATNQVDYPTLAPGPYSVELRDVNPSCNGIASPNPAMVTVVSGQTQNVSFTVDCSNLVQPSTSTLTVLGGGSGDGVVTSSPGGINCTITNGVSSGTCVEQFATSATVSLTAVSSSGAGEQSTFTAWAGDCSGSSCAVAMGQDRTVTASYQQFFELLIQGAGGGSGTVTDGAGISCTIAAGSTSGTCSDFFAAGATVNVMAVATGQDMFAGWSGACTGAGNCSVTLTQPDAVTATFSVAAAQTLTISGGGDGDGLITSSPGAINCTVTNGVASGTCTDQFALGTQVALTAAPTSSAGEMSTFTAWSGACTGTSCSVTMDQNHGASAAFQQFFQVVVNGAGLGSGTVTGGGGVNCTISAGTTGGTCSEFVKAGGTLGLTATPSGQDIFAGWAGACTGTGACNVTTNQPEMVTATFDKPVTPPTISNLTGTVTSLNDAACNTTTPVGSLFDLILSYSDPNGDVTQSQTKVVVDFVFSGGGGGTASGSPSAFTGDGFNGTITLTGCLLFGNNSFVDHTVIITDAAGNESNALTVRTARPTGANSVGVGASYLVPEAESGGR